MAKAKKVEKKTLKERMDDLNKKYGDGSVLYGEVPIVTDVISTGSLGLDIATGIGGIPISNEEEGHGKIIEIRGWESSGKSTLVQTIIGNAQKRGINVLLVDSENSIDPAYAKSLGVDINKLYIVQLDETAGEGAFDKMQNLVDSGEIGLVIVDSYNALQPKKVIDDGLDAANMGLFARMMSKVCAKSNNQCSQFGTTFLFCGQYRLNIGQMYGDPSVTQGGKSLGFYAHMIIETSRSTTNDNSLWEGKAGDSEKLGNLHKVKVLKNKLAAPFKKAEYNIIYGQGVDKYQEIIDLGPKYLEGCKKRAGIFTIDGDSYTIEDFINILKSNDDYFEEMRNKILQEALNNKNLDINTEETEEEKIAIEPGVIENLAKEMEK